MENEGVMTIKIAEGIRVDFDGHIEEFRHHNWDDVMDYINMFKDKELRRNLFVKFYGFGMLDLTEAYQGHRLVITWIPVGE